MFISLINFGNIFRLSFTTNNNKIPIFVTYTCVTSARIWDVSTLKMNLLPNSCILLTYLLNNSRTVYFIEKYFTFSLASINIDFIINYTTTMRITCFRNITNLLTFFPLQRLIFIEETFIHTLRNLSTISQIKLKWHSRNRIMILRWHWHLSLYFIQLFSKTN